MARYVETKVDLTAGQAAGTDPILAADTSTGGNIRRAVVFGNPNAADCNLHLTAGAAHNTGMPVSGYDTASFDIQLPGLDNALYVTGLAAGNFVTLWVA